MLQSDDIADRVAMAMARVNNSEHFDMWSDEARAAFDAVIPPDFVRILLERWLYENNIDSHEGPWFAQSLIRMERAVCYAFRCEEDTEASERKAATHIEALLRQFIATSRMLSPTELHQLELAQITLDAHRAA